MNKYLVFGVPASGGKGLSWVGGSDPLQYLQKGRIICLVHPLVQDIPPAPSTAWTQPLSQFLRHDDWIKGFAATVRYKLYKTTSLFRANTTENPPLFQMSTSIEFSGFGYRVGSIAWVGCNLWSGYAVILAHLLMHPQITIQLTIVLQT